MAVRRLCTILAVFIALAFCLPGLKAEKKALTKEDVLQLLTGVPPERVAEIVREKGVSFTLTRAAEDQIRQAGGNDELLKAIREVAPKPTTPATSRAKPAAPEPSPSPPVLLIEATPGDAQVYVDDELVGTTSREGRLKLSRLSPGEHRVRLAHPGFQDYEQTLPLNSGETTRVTTNLQAVAVTPAQTPTQPAAPVASPASTVSGAPGYLGVLPVEQQPVGSRGVVISGAEPGGPADRAGLKVYDTILSIDGRQVRTSQELQAAIASHSAGDTVEVTWSSGSGVVTKYVQLSPRPAGAPPRQEANPPSLPAGGMIPQVNPQVVYQSVMHDHGSAGKDYCIGVMAIGNGMIQYTSANGIHVFSFPLSDVREAKRNGVYLVKLGAFHIKLVKGTNYNFVALDSYGRFQPPDAVLAAIDRAMGKR